MLCMRLQCGKNRSKWHIWVIWHMRIRMCSYGNSWNWCHFMVRVMFHRWKFMVHFMGRAIIRIWMVVNFMMDRGWCTTMKY